MYNKKVVTFSARIPIELTLGNYYIVWWNPDEKIKCKLIQPTEFGYNFLNIETNKCILKYHLYKSKYEPTLGKFYINKNLKISKYNNEKECNL